MKLKYKLVFTTLIVFILAISMNGSTDASIDSQSKPRLEVYEHKGGVKAEWAVEMLEDDVLYRTGFEIGDELPKLNYNINSTDPPNRLNGGQSYDSSNAVEGKRSLRVEDSYSNGNYRVTDLSGEIGYHSYTNAIFEERKYVENGAPLSMSFKAKTTGKGSITMTGVGGRADFGTPLNIKFTKDVKAGDRTVHIDNVTFFKDKVDEGQKFYLANMKGAYTGNIHIVDYDVKAGTIRTNNSFKGKFKAGDNLLRHKSRAPVSFGNRSIGKKWQIYNLNTNVANFADYNTALRGFQLWIRTTTGDIVHIDDLKMGYATQAELYRDGEKIYEGKLSDFEDKAAVDKSSPDEVEDYTVLEDYGTLHFNVMKPSDNGTKYIYELKAISSDKNEVIVSDKKEVNIESGLAGYSYIVSSNKDAKPSGNINNTNGNIKLDENVEDTDYISIQSIDNAGNKSKVTTFKVSSLRDKVPNVELGKEEGDWAGQHYTHIVADYSKLDNVMYKIEETDISSTGEWIEKTSSSNPSVEMIKDTGIYYIHLKAKDNYGNEVRRSSKAFKIDLTKPSISTSMSTKDWSRSVDLHVESTDEHSGIDDLYLLNTEDGNLTSYNDWKLWHGDNYSQKKGIHTISVNELGRSGVFIPETFLDSDEMYVLSFDITKLEGDMFHIGGHSSVAKYAEVYLDGERQISVGNDRNDWHSGIKYPNDNEMHHITIKFKVGGDVRDKTLHIQPNRTIGGYPLNTGLKTEIKNIQLERGDKETPYKPNIRDTTIGSNPLSLTVSNNGIYTFETSDNVGNLARETIEVNNIDKDPPVISVSQNTSKWTNGNVLLNIEASDDKSGLKSLKYIGENMIKNSSFSDGDKHWEAGSGGGSIRIENELAILDDDVSRNKLRQSNAFIDSEVETKYYAEVKARGTGVLNVRYGGTIHTTEYKQEVTSKSNFKTYLFPIIREPGSNDNLQVERLGEGWLEIENVKVYAQKDLNEDSTLEVTENGNYIFVAEDKVGNVATETHVVDNIDKNPPSLSIEQDITEETHKNVKLSVDARDDKSGVKSVTYLGENMIKDGKFNEGNKYWGAGGAGGEIRVKKGSAFLDDNNVNTNKLKQDNAFKGSEIGAQYYAEVKARGKGVMNARYSVRNGGADRTYKQTLKSEADFHTYRFPIVRTSYSHDHFHIERLGKDGWIEVSEVRLFAQKDITDSRELEVTRNGEYTFVVEDHAGNITTKSHVVDNIVRNITLTKPIIESNLKSTIGHSSIETDIEGLNVTDWRDEVDNDWKLSLEATKLTNNEHVLPSGSISVKGINNSELNSLLNDDTVIDDGKVEIVNATNKRGVYDIKFEENALKFNILANKVKKGSYNTKLTWTLESGPNLN